MNDKPRTSEHLSGADDDTLGDALATAISQRVDTPAARPPVSLIAKRAAAQARARHTRQAVVGIAASVALVAGGIAAWNALDEDPVTEVVVVDGPVASTEPAPTTVPSVAESNALPEESLPPANSTGPVAPDTPESLSTGPVLDWVEFDPASVFGSDVIDAYNLTSVGDGRVLVEAYGPESSQALISANGVDWTAFPLPLGFSLEHFDVHGDRWLVAGRSSNATAQSADQAFFSDDEGATWTDLGIRFDPANQNETASIAATLVSGDNMVVAVEARTGPDVASLIVSRGLVPDKESIRGWTSVQGDTVSFTRDESSAPESFQLTPEEEDFLFGGIQTHIRLYSSSGAPAELVADYPGWEAFGVGSSGGFELTLVDDEGYWLLTSPDGRQWQRSRLVDAYGAPVGDSYSYTASHQRTLWTSSSEGGGYRVERSDGAYAPPLFAKLPEGIRQIHLLTAGPAGVAVTAEAGSLPEFASIPDVRLVEGGYELRFNEPPGGLTLWNVSEDSPVYEFDSEALPEDAPAEGDPQPEGLRVVEGEAGGPGSLVFLHPETGDDLVSFSLADLEAALEGSLPDLENNSTAAPEPERGEPWMGWSGDNSTWGWQTVSDAFGLAELSGIDKELTYVELAVGRDFVIARVRPGEVEASEASGNDGDGTIAVAYQPTRWFIARVN